MLPKYYLSNMEVSFMVKYHQFFAGHYVYIYLDDLIPFYVGMGTERRAFKPHSQEVDDRCRDAKFQIQLHSHFHTKAAAHNIERHVTYNLSFKYPLLNKRIAKCLS